MATRFGYQYAEELVRLHGWTWGPPLPKGVIGDRHVIDPISGVEMNPYEARVLQACRDEDKRRGVEI